MHFNWGNGLCMIFGAFSFSKLIANWGFLKQSGLLWIATGKKSRCAYVNRLCVASLWRNSNVFHAKQNVISFNNTLFLLFALFLSLLNNYFFATLQPDSNGNPTSPNEPTKTTKLFLDLEEELRQARENCGEDVAGDRKLTSNNRKSSKNSSRSSSLDFDDWEISINQFIATVLAVTSIVKGFYSRTPIKENIEKMQNNRRKCISSIY